MLLNTHWALPPHRPFPALSQSLIQRRGVVHVQDAGSSTVVGGKLGVAWKIPTRSAPSSLDWNGLVFFLGQDSLCSEPHRPGLTVSWPRGWEFLHAVFVVASRWQVGVIFYWYNLSHGAVLGYNSLSSPHGTSYPGGRLHPLG